MAEDRTIDAALRDVPVPADIRQRLSGPVLFADDVLDRLLVDVAIPDGLAERVRAAVLAPTHGQGVIDLDRIGAPSPTPRPARPPAAAAARWFRALARDGGLVALSLCGVAALFLGGTAVSRRLETGPAESARAAPRTVAQSRRPPLEDAGTTLAAPRPAPPSRTAAPATDTVDAAAAGMRLQPPAVAPPSAPNIATDDPIAIARAPDPGVVANGPTVRGAPLPPSWSGVESPAAGMRFVDPPAWSHRGVPRVRGYDLAFELRYGEAPFVDPSADPILAVDRPPLSLRTDTFDALRLTPGRRLDASARPVRVEHVLAALPAAPFPTTASSAEAMVPRLDVYAVRSLRTVDSKQSLLVEASVSAPALDRMSRNVAVEPVDATIVLDRSVGGARLAWPWTCRALAAVAAQMGPRDRLTVVVAGPQPHLALRRRGAADVASLASTLERLSPTGFADLDAALSTARAVQTPGTQLIVVAQAGSIERGGDPIRTDLAEWRQAVATATAGGRADRLEDGPPRFVVLDAAATNDPATDDSIRTAAEPVAIRRAVVRQVFSTPTLTARQCRLDVAFDPGQVAAYRIIGHRQPVVDSLDRESAAPIDLHAGETVRVVYEVLPRSQPGATAGNRLATVTLSWLPPAAATPKETRAMIGGAGPDVTAPLPSARGCELLLAVGLGDLAGESAHVGHRDATATRLTALANGWQKRGDVTPAGMMLIGGLEHWLGDHRGTR